MLEYCRIANERTQSDEIATLQAETLEIWGRAARGSDIPSVKAYGRLLGAGEKGINFGTPISPEGTPQIPQWYLGFTEGVELRQKDGDDYACIAIDDIDVKQP